MFWFPAGYGIPFSQGQGVGLQITNNEGTSFYVEGKIVVAYWPGDQRREIEDMRDVGRGRAPWLQGGGRLFP
jgi:hypothetical protein